MSVKLASKLCIISLALCLTAAAPTPARAVNMADVGAYTAWGAFGVVAASTMAYIAWHNRPGNQDKVDWSPKGPGGFYLGGYMGGSTVHSQDFKFDNLTFPGMSPTTVTASTLKFAPGVVGGLKLGYYFHSLPHFGVEVESSFNRNDIRQAAVTFDRAFGDPPSNQGHFAAARLYIWNMAFNFVARYGFLPDKEVTFGRLQPYVGIGPGFVLIFSWRDAAKNFSLDAQAGVRYMLRRNLSTFVEYKFSHQWEVELEDQLLISEGLNDTGKGRATFDYTNHKIVVGLAYHFL
jgi:opacity protein-like surface antigen